MRRPLAETLADLAGAAMPFGEAELLVRVTSLVIDMPLEIRMRKIAEEYELLADVPTWRWQTGFEEPRSRLKIRWEEGETV